FRRYTVCALRGSTVDHCRPAHARDRRRYSSTSTADLGRPNDATGIDHASAHVDHPLQHSATRRTIELRLEYLLHIIHLPFRFIDRTTRTAIFPLDQANDRITIVSDERQAFPDGRVAGAQLNIGTLASLAIFNMDMRDAVVMLTKERCSVIIPRRVMTDVEVDHERFRHTQQLFHAFGCGHLIGILDHRVWMPRRSDLVFLRKGRDARAHSNSSLIRRE